MADKKREYDLKLCHGGELRKQRAGRKQRPLSCNDVIHVVFKIHREKLRTRSLRTPKTYALIQEIVRRYSRRFLVKVERITIQGDHIHALIRTHRRSLFHHFFRVVAGQIAQRSEVTDTPGAPRSLWKHRPFSRIVRGWRSYEVVKAYVVLNELEATGKIPYRKERLSGLSTEDWRLVNGVLSQKTSTKGR